MSNDFMNDGFGSGQASAGADGAGLVFDLSGVDENASSFEVLPKGTYNVIIDECELTEAKSSGAPMLAMKYVIDGGEYDSRVIFDYIVLGGKPKAIELGQQKLKKLLVRVCPEVDIQHFNVAAFNEQGTAIGKRCQIVLGIQTNKSGDYKGEKRNNVKDILAPSNDSFM